MGLGVHPINHVVNVQWGGSVYVIIHATNNDYASSNPDVESVKVLETQSKTYGEGAEPASGTLIESPMTAGEDFITLHPTSSNPIGVENIYVFVCPKVDEVKDNWFDYVKSLYEGDFSDDHGLPLRPFLWITHSISGSPNVMNFKIRYENHLITPPDPDSDIKDMMVQAYPTSGNNTWPYEGYVITGWEVIAYRLDKDGTGDIYTGQQDLWMTDNIVTFPGPTPPFKGLKFGTDPPKISSDKKYL